MSSSILKITNVFTHSNNNQKSKKQIVLKNIPTSKNIEGFLLFKKIELKIFYKRKHRTDINKLDILLHCNIRY